VLGADTDKFVKFGHSPVAGKIVGATVITECLAIERKIVDLIPKQGMVMLEDVATHVNVTRKKKRMLHAVGDGTFIADGRKCNRRRTVAAKLPADL
jgi:hypothetical protein